jgi:hypothetical protein
MGSLLPLPNLNKESSNPEEAIGEATIGISGVAGSFARSIYGAGKALAKGEPLEAGKNMPGALGNVSKALDAWLMQQVAEHGGVQARDGSRLTRDPETGEFRDLTAVELWGQAMGFTPTIISTNREEHFYMTGEQIYWQTRRSNLVQAWVQARTLGDKDAESKVSAKIAEFRDEVPSPAMRITGKQLLQAYKTRKQGSRQVEQQGVKGKMYRGLAKDVQGAFAD